MDENDTETKTKEVKLHSQENTQWGARDTELNDSINNLQVPKEKRK
jgi:hypothetical protein